jgi:hypothetical protein
LRRLKRVPDIRKALTELPETLDESYERILSSVLCQSRKFVHNALYFLAFHASHLDEMCLDALADAVVVDTKRISFSPENRLLQPKKLVEICACSVSYNDKTDEIVLAHYMAREYLESERVKPASFHIFETTFHNIFSKSAIIYMLNADYRQAYTYPFLEYALKR